MDLALVQRLEDSFKLIAPRGPELVDRFYAHLFAKNPGLRAMFPADLAAQKKKLLAAIGLIMQYLRRPEQLTAPLRDLGERHVAYGAQLEHYPIVRDTLIGVMRDMSGPAWSAQLTADWTAALNLVVSIMLEGHRASLASVEHMG